MDAMVEPWHDREGVATVLKIHDLIPAIDFAASSIG